MESKMKGIMIAAPNSNSGKTVITLGLLRYFKNKGMDVRGFKSGPDYIDTKFHEISTRRPASNLDLYMMGLEGVKHSVYLNSG
ncbi:cobyrinate a,c-diamide synthase, partial [Bacillus licheniformis]|uniref:nucleotide-binding protein n=1 Tax=Bacillus licheniformis TaxID=1402 RepID=UPI000FA28F74